MMELLLPDYGERHARMEVFASLFELFSRLEVPLSPVNIRPASAEAMNREYAAFHVSLPVSGSGETREPPCLFLLSSSVGERVPTSTEVREFLRFFARPECPTLTVQQITQQYHATGELLFDIRVSDKIKEHHFLFSHLAHHASRTKSCEIDGLGLRQGAKSEAPLRFTSIPLSLSRQQSSLEFPVPIPSSFFLSDVGRGTQLPAVLRTDEGNNIFMEIREMKEKTVEEASPEDTSTSEKVGHSLPAEVRIEGISMNFLHYLALEEGDELVLSGDGFISASLRVGGVTIAEGKISLTEEGFSFSVGEKSLAF